MLATHHHRKISGAAPKFICGLADIELHEGEVAEVSGRSYKRKKKRHEEHNLETSTKNDQQEKPSSKSKITL